MHGHGFCCEKGKKGKYMCRLVTFFTAFHSTQLLYLTFLSTPNGYETVICSAYDSSYQISISLFLLVIPSVLIGFYAQDMIIGF
jgi:hypothetical protein